MTYDEYHLLRLNDKLIVQKIRDWGLKIKYDPILMNSPEFKLTVFSSQKSDVAKLHIIDLNKIDLTIKIRNAAAREFIDFCDTFELDYELIKRGKSTK